MLTDIHHHMVYGVDDGAGSIADALQMLRIAAQQGVGRIVCTSHDMPGERPLDTSQYLDHLAMLNEMVRRESIPVTLYSGSQILFTPETPRVLQTGQVLPIAGGRRLLMEFLLDMPWTLMCGAVKLVRDAGYEIVLAHVERYACLHDDFHRIEALRGTYDVCMQMNADTILRSASLWKGRWARQVMKAGLIDVVASDAHGVDSRTCRLGEAYRYIAKHYSQEIAEQLCVKAPEAMVENVTDATDK